MGNLPLSTIRMDGGTQTRERLNEETIREYMLDMLSGAEFPPVIVYHDGTDYWLADGFHRVFAAGHANRLEIEADVKQGTRRDAILHSVSANATHGLRRTNEDKRRAVQMLLTDEEWARWSDNEIARRTGVSQPFVSELRKGTSYNDYKIAERNGTTYTINTTNIGQHSESQMKDHQNGQEAVTFEESPNSQSEPPPMPSKSYHANNRSVGDQFHSKLMWNYEKLNLPEGYHQFTIGYAQRSWDQVAELLAVAAVEILMDVRRDAVSQYKPEFSKQALQLACSKMNIQYIHAPELGVEYEDRAELSDTHDYQTLFELYEERLTPNGIIEAINKRILEFVDTPLRAADALYPNIAYMCVEIDPATCHRSRIAKALEEVCGFAVFDL